jgi:hypothetical protein
MREFHLEQRVQSLLSLEVFPNLKVRVFN